ncbi:MAG: Lysine--tRNA ligase [candidate division WS2 bacterium]|uniref:Lysine--tRNA ligase n=1 Tax=Psychracetigena formicireducens TaxID=2986056 RepID=A0A9E2F150_PSYF1|nr:Lysine--tRNA ligase [Candidatus Psychracetigena formicireducens]MBT9144387.1 Lysine--tRNA ligase [Candidatus Psychracetigena formicireducens]
MDEKQQRLNKLNRLVQQGIDPYGHPFPDTESIQHIKADFSEKENVELVHKIGGRVMAFRDHGKSVFLDIVDETGRIQAYIKESTANPDDYHFFKEVVDVGDILGLKGPLFRTKRGEITLEVKEWHFLAKALLPLPEKWHGLKDIEQRYRYRYLDLLVNPTVKENFVKRSKMLEHIRNYLYKNDFLEVETPVLQSLAGGALAKPFITHHEALDMDLYLRIAPELYLKRLVVGSIYKVFEVSKNFRNEGISTIHNPEFTMIEIYWAFQDYRAMMKLTEEIIKYVVKQLLPDGKTVWEGVTIDFLTPFTAMEFRDIFYQKVGTDMEELRDLNQAKRVLKAESISLNRPLTWENIVDKLFKEKVESQLINPTFITGYPVELSPLAKERADNPKYTDRFELFIGGMEIANGFTELNDPFIQRDRFLAQLKNREKGDVEAHQVDEDYLLALEYALPPTGGLGIGMDRLTMVILGLNSIREVILFPHLRPPDKI